MICNSLIKDFDYTISKLTNNELEKLKDSTVLLTGCAGFLGYYFMKLFQYKIDELGIKSIIALDNFMLGTPKWVDELSSDQRFSIQKFDIIKDDIKDVKGAEAADYIVHMASIASPMFYRQYPLETLDANIWGLRSLLEFYKDKAIKGLLFFSSSEIYGDPDVNNIPTTEEYRGSVSVTGPRACYDEAKRFGETMCMLFAQKFSMPIGVARPFNNYGPGMKLNDKRVPADFAKAVIENRDIEILSSGSPSRTFCYIADAISGYFKILLHGKYDYFNIGIEEPEITVKQLADIYIDVASELFGYTGKVIYDVSDDKQYLTHNPQRRCPDIQKARSILGYNPTITVEDGIKRFLHFIKENEQEELIW